jgi:hypothetical protein
MARGNELNNKFMIEWPNLVIYVRYVFQTLYRQDNREILATLLKLMNKMDPEKVYDIKTQEKHINVFKFLKALLERRLNGNKDKDLLIEVCTDGLIKKHLPLNQIDNPLNSSDFAVIEQRIYSDYENYSVITYMAQAHDKFIELTTAGSQLEREAVLKDMRLRLRDIGTTLRQTANTATGSETFSLTDSDVFIRTMGNVYDRLHNPSTKLKTGMQAFNNIISGGFENGRIYLLFGLPGEGKSMTMLNLALQLKKFNRQYQPKDPTKRPCIVYLTMENSLEETIERAHGILVAKDFDKRLSLEEMTEQFKNSGFAVTDDDPIDIVIKYIPANTVDTDYVYALYDELADSNKEVICMVQDYIKRIKCRDFDILGKDPYMALGSVVDEFKQFAIDKDIPVITASQLNREAAKAIDEGRKISRNNLVECVGRNNIGESIKILENIDSGIIIIPEKDAADNPYMGFSLIKSRYGTNAPKRFYHPFNPEKPVELFCDEGCTTPVHRLTMTDLSLAAQNAESVRNTKPEEVKSAESELKSTDPKIPVKEEPKEEAKPVDKEQARLERQKKKMTPEYSGTLPSGTKAIARGVNPFAIAKLEMTVDKFNQDKINGFKKSEYTDRSLDMIKYNLEIPVNALESDICPYIPPEEFDEMVYVRKGRANEALDKAQAREYLNLIKKWSPRQGEFKSPSMFVVLPNQSILSVGYFAEQHGMKDKIKPMFRSAEPIPMFIEEPSYDIK